MITVLCCQCLREVPDEPAARFNFDVSGIPFFLCNQCCEFVLSQWWTGEPTPRPAPITGDPDIQPTAPTEGLGEGGRGESG